MTGSCFDPGWPDTEGRPLAHGHDADGRQVSAGYSTNPEPAAGGLWTTAVDLAALAASCGGATWAGGDRAGAGDAHPQSYRAYGWSTILHTTCGDREFGHGGQAYDYRAMAWMRVHSGCGPVMLSNAVTDRELIRHLTATELSGRIRLTGEWQRAIEAAVGRERGGTA
ncbi:serine hydrolase domain-containing protein [Streptomyces griseofuscus]|uniref:Non-ribosomal peptide synthetase n=1 Tax=Streptomyces griseofuscus TaxID=146922 RepID=A0A7H1PRC4_9ACTN|nr:serine hydrolase [Streptomyces griseofuscus]QNT90604.1 non-ribosomal peptide synthetase [Streptomyces griseofuscus]